MKKIHLKLGKEMLSKEQMKKVTGGNCDPQYSGGDCGSIYMSCGPNEVLYACGWTEGWGAGVSNCYGSVFYTCGSLYDYSCGHRCDIINV